MYQITFIILLLLSFWEVISDKRHPRIFMMVYAMVTVIATFRYGQLADYFAYGYMYINPEVIINKDFGFAMLIAFSRWAGLDFTAFMAVLSFLIMALAYPFFARYCKYSFIALFVYFAYTFMQGTMTATRQGLCISILLCIYPLLEQRKYLWYCLLVLLGSTFHASFLAALVIPFIYRSRIFHDPITIGVVLLFAAMSFVGVDYTQFLPSFLQERTASYTKGAEAAGLLQIGLRTLIILPVLFYKPEKDSSGYYAKSICILGFILYCLMAFDTLTSARVEFYFRSFFCLLVAYIVNVPERIKKGYVSFILVYLIAIHSFLWFKNMDFAIENGGYTEDITPLNFPYISIFNPNDIDSYSTIREANEIYLVDEE